MLKDNDIEIYSKHNDENLLLWCGLLVPWRMKPTKKWLQFKKMCILIN